MSEATEESVVEAAGLSKVFKDFWGRPKAKAVNSIDFKVKIPLIRALTNISYVEILREVNVTLPNNKNARRARSLLKFTRFQIRKRYRHFRNLLSAKKKPL